MGFGRKKYEGISLRTLSNFLLDSDVIIHILKGKLSPDYLYNLGGDVFVSVISFSEVLYGQKKFGVLSKETLLSELTSVLDAHILPIGSDEVVKYIDIRLYLEGLGLPLEKFDLLIAATALVQDAHLVTKNLKHFSRIPNLKIYS